MSTEHTPRATPTPADQTRLVAMAFELANARVIEDLESYATRQTIGGWTWWDTRPMLDPREHAPEAIDMARQAIDYALSSGLAMRHPREGHLVHVLRTGNAKVCG